MKGSSLRAIIARNQLLEWALYIPTHSLTAYYGESIIDEASVDYWTNSLHKRFIWKLKRIFQICLGIVLTITENFSKIEEVLFFNLDLKILNI